MSSETRVETIRKLNRKQFLGLGAAGAGMVALAGCGSAGSSSGSSGNKSLTLGSIGWTENTAVSTLTKLVMEDKLGYKVNIKGPLDLGPLFQGVATGDLAAFQDVWLPNNQQYVDKVKKDVKLLSPWYQGQTKYDIAVPAYMKNIKSIADLKKTGLKQITGIEPGASINPQIRNKVFKQYDLGDFKLVTSSTAAMLAQLQKSYKDKAPIIFLAWSPHWMNVKYDITYLKDPKDALGSFNNPAKIRAVVNKGLQKDDPKAYAFLKAIKLDEKQVNDIELEMNKAGDGNTEKGVRNWLNKNKSVVQPWVKAAKSA